MKISCRSLKNSAMCCRSNPFGAETGFVCFNMKQEGVDA